MGGRGSQGMGRTAEVSRGCKNKHAGAGNAAEVGRKQVQEARSQSVPCVSARLHEL